MGLFFKMVMRSVKRRRREMRFVSAAVFIAVLFLSGISVFQNVMNRYVTEKNYLNYGEWILSVTEELKSEEPAPFERLEHPYLLEKGISSTGGEVLDRDGVGTGKYVGAIDEAFAEMGNVSLYEGRLPENSDEIAMDLPALAAMGYSYDLGQTISIGVQTDEYGNGDASYESTEKQLASMFEAKEMSFYSNIETIRVNAENMVRGVSIYGSMMAVGISVYLVLQLNMRRNQGFYLRGEYRLFRRMGMEERTFHRMALSDGVKQAVWSLAGIPCAYILIFCQKYAEQVRLAEASKGQGMIYEVYSNLLNGFTQNLPVLALDRVLIDAAPLWELSVCILMIIVFLISTAVGIRSMEKGESRL